MRTGRSQRTQPSCKSWGCVAQHHAVERAAVDFDLIFGCPTGGEPLAPEALDVAEGKRQIPRAFALWLSGDSMDAVIVSWMSRRTCGFANVSQAIQMLSS